MFNYSEISEENLEFIVIANVSEVLEGEPIIVDIDGETIALFQVAGEFFAIADVCSHDDGPVAEGEIEGHEIICPRHGAHFDVRTGKALTLPAVVDIPAYPVRVEDGEVLVGVPIKD